MSRKTYAIKFHNKGFSYGQISKIIGTSRQWVHRIIKNPSYPKTNICQNCGDIIAGVRWPVKVKYCGRWMGVDEGCKLMLLEKNIIEE